MSYSDLVSIHKLKKRCQICDHKDNCAETRDGSRAYCRRWREAGRSDGHVGRDGGMLFVLYETNTPPPKPIRKLLPPKVKADRSRLDMVYRSVLHILTLYTPHKENLVQRGLDDLSIFRGRFKSTPTEEEAERIVESISAEYDLSGVPGFYKDRRWKMVKVPSGFFVPVLDREGRIQGLQIRRDYLRHPKAPRYTWFSSNPADYKCGTSSGAPVHVQNPERMSTGRVMIIEGALKAFIASRYLSPDDGGILALAGVSTFSDNFGQQIKRAWPELHTATVCFDADWHQNMDVKRQLHRLIRTLKSASLSVTIRAWPREKGIDDYLVSESIEVAA